MTAPTVRVLLIEDDRVDRLACRRALAHHPRYDFAFLEADTARAGLQLAQTGRPDLVLLDHHLPDDTGLEVLAELVPAFPVVMLTGADNIAVAVEAMRRGARDYLVKDGDRRYLELLPAVIERVLREDQALAQKRQAEAETRRYRAELERLYQQHALGAMASLFAHELNQPLAAVVGYSEASLRRLRAGNGDSELMHYLEQTAQQAQRAAQIVRHVRNFLRRGELDTTPENVAGLARQVIAQVASDASPYAIALAPGAESVPPVQIGRAAVEKVLLSLLHNAIEAMRTAGDTGGTITLSAHVVEPGFVRVTVADSGPGFDPEQAERLFQPFYTTKPEGLGLGLAISRTLIEAHGGRMWAEAAARGATIHFTLPATP